MQAGDTLDFILPFNGLEKEQNELEQVSEEDMTVLTLILRRFINEQGENVHSFVTLEPFGLVTVFEASYRIDMEDQSYLHVVVHGSQTDEGFLEFGVSINEHLPDSTYNGGHSYMYDQNGLRRSTSMPDLSGELSEEDRELLRTHYMVSDFYADRELLAEAKRSEDTEDREHAEQIQTMLESELTFDAMSEAAGFDNQPPYPGEMQRVQELIWNARPFPLHLTPEE